MRTLRTVLKIGGELIERTQDLARIAGEVVRMAADGPLVIVHGGGRTIDAGLAARGIAKRSVDGLRVTDEPTLDVVVSILAGLVNTRFVAAISAARGRAVGLTGADGLIGLVEKAPPHLSAAGSTVDLGLVGTPVPAGTPRLLVDLCDRDYVPVVASIGASPGGSLLNVNADTWAAHLAVQLQAHRLIVAGTTAGVLDGEGRTLDTVDVADVERLIRSGEARAGMAAKLTACRQAAAAGVDDVRIVDGRGPAPLDAARGTRVTRRDWNPARADDESWRPEREARP